MKVKVFDSNQILKEEYDTPPGFRLERYITSLHPKSNPTIRFICEDFCIDVYEGDGFIERHLGKYKEKIL